MKTILKKILYWELSFFYKELNKNDNHYPIKTLYKYAFKQKILGYNRKTPWPVHYTSKIVCPEKIIRGTKYPGFAQNIYIDGRNGIILGENVWMGPKVSIISQNHNVNNYDKYIFDKPIIVGKNSWLSTACILLPGVELGEHTVVAAGAIVTKSFLNKNQVIAGNPAKVVKTLDEFITE
ncbi:MAG: acyltransferase [Bacteroidales bacterium]|jgi:acetyltransferase-like isoleucine patch superfamily enzyme|nr:acyltransferase [Bacteroidales bacterium]